MPSHHRSRDMSSVVGAVRDVAVSQILLVSIGNMGEVLVAQKGVGVQHIDDQVLLGPKERRAIHSVIDVALDIVKEPRSAFIWNVLRSAFPAVHRSHNRLELDHGNTERLKVDGDPVAAVDGLAAVPLEVEMVIIRSLHDSRQIPIFVETPLFQQQFPPQMVSVRRVARTLFVQKHHLVALQVIVQRLVATSNRLQRQHRIDHIAEMLQVQFSYRPSCRANARLSDTPERSQRQ